jgi:hypothetical protein
MKRAIIVMSVVMMFVMVAGAGLSADVSWGVKGGVNFAKFRGDDADISGIVESTSKFGFAAGIYAKIAVVNFISVQPEALFTLKGENQELGGLKGINVNLYYLEFPILVKVYPLPSPSIQPNVFFGPYIGLDLFNRFVVKDDIKTAFELLGFDTDGEYEDVKRIDFGLVFGGGVDIGKVGIDGRYAIGLISTDDSTFDLDLKNSVFSILVSFALK